jgi:hypothetical protein
VLSTPEEEVIEIATPIEDTETFNEENV